MDQYSLPSDKASDVLEARVRSMIDALQKEFGISAGGIFWAFMLIILDIDNDDVRSQMILYNKMVRGETGPSDLLKAFGSYAGKR